MLGLIPSPLPMGFNCGISILDEFQSSLDFCFLLERQVALVSLRLLRIMGKQIRSELEAVINYFKPVLTRYSRLQILDLRINCHKESTTFFEPALKFSNSKKKVVLCTVLEKKLIPTPFESYAS